MNIKNVISKPVITPKAIKLQEKHNKYTFMVNKNVNKNQIKYAL
ncbi:MAG: 50S ribosomal protein L23, partial [Lachnospiraceae bacterium]|nr:50S ribosomal protein L23 [Lachnospiraceae bacterium]